MLHHKKTYILISVIFIILILLLISVHDNYYDKVGKNLNLLYDTFYYRLYHNSKYYNNLNNDEKLEDKLEDNVFLLFNATWCKECKEIKRKGLMSKLGKKYKIYVINDTHPCVKEYKDKLNFDKFPSLYMYKNEKFVKVDKIDENLLIKYL